MVRCTGAVTHFHGCPPANPKPDHAFLSAKGAMMPRTAMTMTATSAMTMTASFGEGGGDGADDDSGNRRRAGKTNDKYDKSNEDDGDGRQK